MSEPNQTVEDVLKPNPVKSFFDGFKSGAFSGAIMGTIFWLTSTAISYFPVITHLPVVGSLLALAAGPVPILGIALVTALFTGTMAVIRGDKEAKSAAMLPVSATTPMLVQGAGRGPQMTMDAADDMAPTRRDGQSWASSVGENSSRQSRIQQIINDGSISDKSRASAILAERDAAAAEAGRA